ncbi:MAG: hypothetical protein ACYDHY_06505 [Acidiferrobacterales bacterium]
MRAFILLLLLSGCATIEAAEVQHSRARRCAIWQTEYILRASDMRTQFMSHQPVDLSALNKYCK